MSLTYLTAGESHGKGILALLDGFPAGLEIDTDKIDALLRLRQGGYGRGGRQQIETDTVDVLTGVKVNRTLGSPVALWVKNRDYKLPQMPELERPRPGHGDLSGSRKYQDGIRPILERSSARETAAKVAAGALAEQLLDYCAGIRVLAYVVRIGEVELTPSPALLSDFDAAIEKRNVSPVYSLASLEADKQACNLIDKTREAGDTVGGIIEIRATGLPFGLGSHAQWTDKLDGRLAQAVMAVQAIKGVEIGLGFQAGFVPGSQAHDAIGFDPKLVDTNCLGFVRPTNRAGGLEAGMTNSQDIVVRAAMKPIPTMLKPMVSINLTTKQPSEASYERSDVCAVPAAAIVLESVVAMTLATVLTEKFGCDNVEEIRQRISLFHKLAREK